MTYLLSCGEKRSRVWMTQLAVLLSALFLLIAFCTLMGIVCSILMFPGVFGYCSLSAAESGMPAATDSIGVHQLSRFFRLE